MNSRWIASAACSGCHTACFLESRWRRRLAAGARRWKARHAGCGGARAVTAARKVVG